jgi:protein involved in polysaccharide export with SLBB domain
MRRLFNNAAALSSRCALFVTGLLLAAAVPALATMLHPGDRVQVTVYNHPDLSGPVTLDGAGQISLPLAGQLTAIGSDPVSLAQRIRLVLSHYIAKVAVDVQLVAQNQSVFIDGGPGGMVAFVPGETLATALAQIQTPQQAPSVSTPVNNAVHNILHGRVDLRKVSVERDGSIVGTFDAEELASAGEPGPLLYPGDTIHLVDKPIRVRVQGDVVEPGFAYLTEAEPESDAIDQVGGPLPTAALADISILRGGTEQQVAIGRPTFAKPAQNGDVISVHRAPTVSVIGAVEHPGETTLHGTPDLISAVYEAGGPQQKADVKHVAVIHDGVRTEVDITGVTHGGDPHEANPTLADGDSVIVPIGHKLDLGSIWQAIVGARLLFP